jgi:poly(3-hydroxybutyrate) depolymerase
MRTVLLLLGLMSFSALSDNFADAFLAKESDSSHLIKKPVRYNEKLLSYFVQMPPSHDFNGDLYIMFHGESSKAQRFLKMTSAHKKISSEAIMLIPDATADDWFYQKEHDFTVHWITNLIELYKTEYKPKRIIGVGYSSGATFLNELVCSGRLDLDVVLSVGGSMQSEKPCNAVTGLKYVHIVGDKDDYYGFNSIKERNSKYKLPTTNALPLNTFSSYWSDILGCEGFSKFNLSDIVPDDDSSPIRMEYNCDYQRKNSYTLLLLEGAGHNWSNNNMFGYSDFRGVENKDIHPMALLRNILK